MVQQLAKAPVTPQPSAATPAPAPAAAGSPLGAMSYAQARAAVTPGAQDYAAGRAAVAPDAAAAEQARAAAARLSYQSLLGEAVGGKLYDEVAKELSPDKILGFGSKGLDAAANALTALIKPVAGSQVMDEASEAEAVRQFAGALADWAKGYAETWLQGDDGKAFAAKASQWVEGHPTAIVVAALLAAAGAVAGNAAIPELQQKFKLGANTTVEGGVNVGKLRDIALRGAHLGVSWQKGDVAASISYSADRNADGTVQQGVKLSASAKTPGDFKVHLDALLADHGKSTVSAGVEKQWGDFNAKADATYNLTDAQLQQVAVEFGFRDKASFDAFVVDYKRNYDGDVPRQQLDLMVQTSIGQMLLRGQSKTVFERDHFAGHVTGLHAAYPVSPDLKLIGGARYGMDDPQHPGLTDHERGAWLEAGVQFRGVPLVVGFRPEDKAVTVGVTIPFGK